MNLKKLLMTLGNKLVERHRFDPPDKACAEHDDVVVCKSTTAIDLFTRFVNQHEEVQAVLAEEGVAWPMTIEQMKLSGAQTGRMQCSEPNLSNVPKTEKRPRRETDQWVDECPRCHHRDCLIVFKVTMVETGHAEYPETPLHPDGFEVDPRGELPHDMKDFSTQDEEVRCDSCGMVFALEDLYLPEEK